MNYRINVKKRKEMRYPTAGDYYENKYGDMIVEICKQSNPDYEFCIMIHELIEEYITRKRGIKEQEIMDFDLQFEAEREEGLHSDTAEPGIDFRAPYRKEHIFAENIERLIAAELNIDWELYGREIIS